jgi:hypothetical protein
MVYNVNNMQTKEEMQDVKQAFIAEMEYMRTTHVVTTKTIPVHVRDASTKPRDFLDIDKIVEYEKSLVFTFYAVVLLITQGNRNDPSAYSITLTDPEDIFFHFTSIPITRDRFRVLTKHIELVHVEPTPTPSRLSRSTGQFSAFTQSKLGTRLGFTETSAVGGVVGVFGNDYMGGTVTDPQRLDL